MKDKNLAHTLARCMRKVFYFKNCFFIFISKYFVYICRIKKYNILFLTNN